VIGAVNFGSPPLVLLLLAGVALAWLTFGSRAGGERLADLVAALRPTDCPQFGRARSNVPSLLNRFGL
jgi:hypothetical protein